MLRLLQGVWICHMMAWMVMVMVIVMVDGEVWQSGPVYLLVGEVMVHQGDPKGVVEEVMVMELMVVVGPKRPGMAEARGPGVQASEIGLRPAPHTLANPPPAPSGAARAAHPRAVRDQLVDVSVVGWASVPEMAPCLLRTAPECHTHCTGGNREPTPATSRCQHNGPIRCPWPDSRRPCEPGMPHMCAARV